jgi:hypothetical protein
MAQTFRFYLVDNDGMVTGTNDLDIALCAKREGSYIVIEPRAAEATIDGDVETIEEADPADFDMDPEEADGEGDDE